MRLLAWGAGAALAAAALPSLAEGLFPDWIRMKDSIAIPCRIISENEKEVEVIMSGGSLEGRVTIDKSQIEWMQRNADLFPPGANEPPPLVTDRAR